MMEYCHRKRTTVASASSKIDEHAQTVVDLENIDAVVADHGVVAGGRDLCN